MTDLERVQYFTHSRLLPTSLRVFLMSGADLAESKFKITNVMNSLTTGGVAMEDNIMDYEFRHYSRLFGFQIAMALLAVINGRTSDTVYGHCEAAYTIEQMLERKDEEDAGVFIYEYAEIV